MGGVSSGAMGGVSDGVSRCVGSGVMGSMIMVLEYGRWCEGPLPGESQRPAPPDTQLFHLLTNPEQKERERNK